MPKRFSYSQEDVSNFLDELEEILPVTAIGWERIAEIHLSRYPDHQHSVDSLKRKFKEQHNKNSYRRPSLPTSCLPSHVLGGIAEG
jgi:hypothetical protein